MSFRGATVSLMKIPTKLKIGALWYPIRFVPSAEIDCDSQPAGDTSCHRQDIRISENLRTQEMKELTLFHEVLHCINDQMAHAEVEYLAQALYQVLKENKLLK